MSNDTNEVITMTTSRRASYTSKADGSKVEVPLNRVSAAASHTEHVPLITIQSLVRSAEATSIIDDETLYNVCRMAVQHGRPRAHANALASMTRSRSTRGRLSYEELHHLMAATISGVEMCDYIPGPAGEDKTNSSRSRRAQKVLVNFCPVPRMHYFYNALTLPEVSQNYFDDIYLRPSASLLAPSVPSTRSHHHHHHIEATNGCSSSSSSTAHQTSTSVGRRLSTVKGTENVAAPNSSSTGMSEAVVPSEVSPASSVVNNRPTDESPTPNGASPAATTAPTNESGTAASDGGVSQ